MDSFKVQLFAILLFVVGAYGASLHSQAFTRHLRTVTMFKCGAPQPRSVELADLGDERLFPATGKILPATTVLYRCEGSGCCKEQKRCLPVAVESVSLVFAHIARGPIRYIEVSAQNHTRCGCEDPSNRPK